MTEQKETLHPVMLAGTGSDVGKSVLAAALCRILKQDGYSPAPFKAQNMALNSYVTPDGLELGRAQAVQAEAAGVPCHTDMNPLLLKPTGEMSSQVVLNGRPAGNSSAYDYFRSTGRGMLRQAVHEAFDRLAARYNPIVMEGAGSIAEVNLWHRDLVNMSMARHAGADVILVADIDRGGVFASAYGAIMLQPEEDRRRIKGIIVNKFRGDLRLFADGAGLLEQLCGVPVLGVVPYFTDIHVDEEDSVELLQKAGRAEEGGRVNVAVVRLPHLSNFTDFHALECDERVHLFYTADAEELRRADILLLPGSKNTCADLLWLRSSGLAGEILCAAARGCTVMGICGGYQMMGYEVADPDGAEGAPCCVPGLGMLPVRTRLQGGKQTRQVQFAFRGGSMSCRGYEIHCGVSQPVEGADIRSLNTLSDGTLEGVIVHSRCMGTYLHGILDNADVVDYLLSPHTSERREKPLDYAAYKEEQYDKLAAHVRRHLDMPLLYRILKGE